MNKLTIGENNFLLNGEPFNIVAGAMHYFRVPREYWRDRLLKIKACGFNTVETYTAWNMHEPEEGYFDFSGDLDLGAYLDLINELGMLAIVRPGPYICSEWDFGGFPWWLLRYDDIELRCSNELYMTKVANYFNRLIPIIAVRQAECGGPVIMVQVENEYGSYGNDSAYLRRLADLLKTNGITCTLFTSDGGNNTMLSGGTLPEIFATCNFGSNADGNFKALREFQKKGPLMCAEYWNGWFDHWGEKHHKRAPFDAVKHFSEILDKGSVSVYMAHGGTNFGYMNGANCYDKYEPTVNSYDDDAPINEYGAMTEKYYLFKNELESRGFKNNVELDNVPAPVSYPSVKLTHEADLLENLDILSQEQDYVCPLNMEELGQGYGFICYKTFIKGPKDKDTLYFTAHDRAYVFLDGEYVGRYYRNDTKQNISFKVPAKGAQLTILVENMGRVNYGPKLFDKKGIIGGVRFGQQFVYHWKHYPLPLNNAQNAVYFENDKPKFKKRPVLLKGTLSLSDEPKDTFVKLNGFKKGIIIINGRILSRYWDIGPQKTAYLPATFLHKGDNDVVILELEGYKKTEVEFCDTPDIG